MFNCAALNAQFVHSTIDTVISFTPGEGQNHGQSPEFFPENIFGPPDTSARTKKQAQSENEVCSIGLGGEIVVGFRDFVIADGPGPDFTIYENAFINPVTGKIFAEPAAVAVSMNGAVWVEFPWDSASLEGCAGITPTNGDKDPFNPAESGGNSFDLADVGIPQARLIRIRDITQMLLYNPGHEYYDPILSGFDLDAVAGINLMKSLPAGLEDSILSENCVKIIRGIIHAYSGRGKSRIEVFDITGSRIYTRIFAGRIQIDLQNRAPGLYFIRISYQAITRIKKIINY